MRNPVRSGFVLLSVLLAGAAIAAQPPVVTKAPAPSTRLPKAFVSPAGPDAEALLLADRYTLRADGAVVHERTQRIRVNSSLAINRDFGESRVVWDPSVETFEVLHNRTVLPSGEVVPGPANAVVDELPPAVHRNSLWSGLRRKVIVHTALEPGAVIEASWRVTRAASMPAGMTVAEPLAFAFPVAQRTVEVEAPSGLELFVPAAVGGEPAADCATTGAVRTCRWRLEGVAALPGEPGTPPRVAMEPYALAAAGAPAGKGWAGAELARRWDAAGPAPAGAVEAARKAVGKEPDRERGLLAALTSLSDAVNVAGALPASHTGWAIHPLASVWSAGASSPLEMAALQARVLGELGFDARPGSSWPAPQAGRAPGFAAPRPGRPPGEVRRGRRSPLRPGGAEGRDAARTPPRPCPPRRPGRPRRPRRARHPLDAPSRGDAHGRREGRLQGRAGADDDRRRHAPRGAGPRPAEALRATRLRPARRGEGDERPHHAAGARRGIALCLVRGRPAREERARASRRDARRGPRRRHGRAAAAPRHRPALADRAARPRCRGARSHADPAQGLDRRGTARLGEGREHPGGGLDERHLRADGRVVVRRSITLAARSAPAAAAGKARELLVAWSSPGSRMLLLRPPAGKP